MSEPVSPIRLRVRKRIRTDEIDIEVEAEVSGLQGLISGDAADLIDELLDGLDRPLEDVGDE